MAPTLTAAVQTTAADGTPVARVLLVLTWPGIQTALIERLDPDGTWRPVRGPDGDQIVCYGSCVAWDHEAPLDQPVTYRATSPQGSGAVNANIFFESGVANWTGGNGGTLASSGTQHHEGALAARLTPNGTTANPNMLADEVAVTVGLTYGANVWLWSTAAFTWRVGLSWYDASHTFLSSNLLNIAMSAGTWTNFSTSAAAPAGAAFVRLTVQANGTPAASNILYADEAMLISPVPLTVWATPGALNGNAFFEAGIAPWATDGGGGTLASSGARTHDGSLALRLAPDGSTPATNAIAEEVAVTVGKSYGANAWLWSTASQTWGVGIAWYTAAHAFVSTTKTTAALSAGTWTSVGGTFTAPATAAFGRLLIEASGTPAATNVLYVDGALMTDPTGPSTLNAVPSGGKAWLSHPGHPRYAAARAVNDLQRTYAGRAGMFWPIGSAVPVAVTDVRGGGQGSVTWQVTTMAEYQQIRALIADGGVLLMRLPTTWGGDSWYIQAGDITEVMPTGIITDGMRRYQMPYTRVDRPAGSTDGALGVTCDDVTATYVTCNALVAAKTTCVALESSVA